MISDKKTVSNKKIDLRIQKTYAALLNAFTQLLDTKAFEDITINELCDTAMIRRTTFYKHFDDKYEYFKFYLSTLSESFKAQLPPATLITDPAAYSVSMLRELFQFIREHKKLVDGIRNSNMMSFLYSSLQEQFARELRTVFVMASQNEPTPDFELLISFYAGGLMNVVYWWLNHPTELSEEEIIELLIKNISPISV